MRFCKVLRRGVCQKRLVYSSSVGKSRRLAVNFILCLRQVLEHFFRGYRLPILWVYRGVGSPLSLNSYCLT